MVVLQGPDSFLYPSSFNSGRDTDSSAMEEEDDLKALEAKIRCMGMKKKPSQGKSCCFLFVFNNENCCSEWDLIPMARKCI